MGVLALQIENTPGKRDTRPGELIPGPRIINWRHRGTWNRIRKIKISYFLHSSTSPSMARSFCIWCVAFLVDVLNKDQVDWDVTIMDL